MWQIRSNLRDDLFLACREAHPEDAERIRDFRHDLAVEGVATSLPHEVVGCDTILRSIRSPHHLRILALLNDRCVGEILLRRGTRFASAHICTLTVAVARDFRGRGVGRALLCAATEAAATHPRLRGVRKFELSTLATNVAALALYESRGFQREGVRRMHVRRRSAEKVVFEDVVLLGLTLAHEVER